MHGVKHDNFLASFTRKLYKAAKIVEKGEIMFPMLLFFSFSGWLHAAPCM